MKKLIFTALVGLGLSMFFAACKKDEVVIDTLPATDFSHDIALEWNTLLLDVERFTPGYKPPVSARTIGYVGLTAYEAIVHGMSSEFNSLGKYYPGLELPQPGSNEIYDWEVCLNAAYEAAFHYFFPTAPASQQFKIISLADRWESRLESKVSQQVFNRSVDFGIEVAHAVYNWSKSDHWGHEAFLSLHDDDYIPPGGTGLWQPTFPDYQPALLPHWGKVRTFAASSGDSVDPPLPYSESSNSPIYLEAKETQMLVREIKAGGRAEDRWIAEFWSDDCPILTFTPAGRWISITNQIVELEKLSLEDAVYAYAKVGLALSDAGVKCWGEKYKHNCERPIDYIRRIMLDTEWNTIMCPDGSGGYYTPNFPTYPSGHATFSSAAAEVLTDLFGQHYAFTDRSHEGRTEFNGTPRSFPDFYSMARENAYSRVPLGVHFFMDSDAGTALGARVGKRVNALPWKN
ncbi:MAG: vanadium-dependent haloperoxidase [Lewinella sp.]|nr:vanadium-dependent haloperoxidase [Lewinella sp.]